MDSGTKEYQARISAGHPGTIYSVSQAGLPEAFERVMRESRKINAVDAKHQVIIGKSRGAAKGFGVCITEPSRASRATGLLASLLCRI